MSQYVDRSLAAGEDVVIRGRWPLVHWIAAWAALILLGWIVVGVIIFAIAALTMATTESAVTNQRVLMKRGWLTLHTQELAVSNVEEVRLEQSLLGRLFGFGRIIVTGTGEGLIYFPPMADPIEFRRAIETARARARSGDGNAKR
jgi:uncharacterized membrane protein YdbT with pleckstrin-like domain